MKPLKALIYLDSGGFYMVEKYNQIEFAMSLKLFE